MTDPILQAPKFEDDDTPKLNPPIVPCWMTKREYFAALAMQGILAGTMADPDRVSFDPLWPAKFAVHSADALIEQLEKLEK
jgi:hypothetical protein